MQEARSHAGTKRSTERKKGGEKKDTFDNAHAATEKTENFHLISSVLYSF